MLAYCQFAAFPYEQLDPSRSIPILPEPRVNGHDEASSSVVVFAYSG